MSEEAYPDAALWSELSEERRGRLEYREEMEEGSRGKLVGIELHPRQM